MDLLDRYLEAVRKHLPWQRQDDIVAELRANLESQLEDSEAELGRPFTPVEVEAWLKRLGPPMQMAARYQPQQYLIGPAIFPIYWYVLKLTLFWAAAVSVIVNVVIFATGAPSWAAGVDAILRVPFVLVTTAGWVTLIFVAIEFAVKRYPGKWSATIPCSVDWIPSKMPSIEDLATPREKRRTAAQAVAEVVFGIVFLVWLLLIPQHPYLLIGPGAAYLQASPLLLTTIWIQFYWCVLALNLLMIAWRLFDLASGTWRQTQRAQEIAMKLFALIPFSLLLSGHVWVTLKYPLENQARYGGTVTAINQIVRISLISVCIIIALQLLWEIAQIGLSTYRKRVTAGR